MQLYSIGEAEELTGIKAHVLRYWESVALGLAPRKSIGGRRAYSARDLQIIMRLKYLIRERKFTIEGACDELIAETELYTGAESAAADALCELHELRGELSDLYLTVRKYRRARKAEETQND